MEIYNDQGSAQGQIIEECFDKLRGEISSLLSRESLHSQEMAKLMTDLSAFKTAYGSAVKDKKELEINVENLRRESERVKHDLENQLRGSRVVCLIDGDGAIFCEELIAQGHEGGLLAAKRLSDAIGEYLSSKCTVQQYQLWVHIFFNKRGLMETLGRAGIIPSNRHLDEFVLGFNQAAERFLMVDVGGAKEAADAKIKAHLEDNIRLPQTCKILFGGCHDNGYATTLRSLLTAGLGHKMILLPGYSDMAAGIQEMGFPSLAIPDLFIPEKIVIASNPSYSTGPPPGLGSNHTSQPSRRNSSGTAKVAFAADIERSPNLNRPSPPSYSSALQSIQMVQDRAGTPELDSNGSTGPESNVSEVPPSNPRSSPNPRRSKHINPNLPLSRQNPPPCTLFYLANCRHGEQCKYGHAYLLNEQHYETIRENAKKSPCPALNKGEICLWGDQCCYGHTCPLTTKCHFLKQGRCKFNGAEMHREI